jgi:hypothetical protein
MARGELRLLLAPPGLLLRPTSGICTTPDPHLSCAESTRPEHHEHPVRRLLLDQGGSERSDAFTIGES